MKLIVQMTVLGVGLLTSVIALAAEQTVHLAVENMTCASCPYIVKQSLTAIPGVVNVAVSFEKKSATVTYDDAKTTADALMGATTKAGYPATLATTDTTATQ